MTTPTLARVLALLSIALLASRPLGAQAIVPPEAPISDNSFIVEEGYNQEEGVVQHIGTFRRDRAGDWLATFTQEWPASTQRDQLSYTLQLQTKASGGSGFGDLIINYRRQVLGAGDDPVWFSPRLSVIVPTGNAEQGTGEGGPGLQVNLPLSVRVTDRLVTHWNVGGTLARARVNSGPLNTARSVTAAASAIWLLMPNLNLMLESAWDRTESIDEAGRREAGTNFMILPGARGAINLTSGMQIVPGIGMPIGVGPSRGSRDVFVYLSVEHPFK